MPISLYYRNVMAEVIGKDHGITPAQFKDLARKTTPLIAGFNAAKPAYRKLPYDTKIADRVEKLAVRSRQWCEILIVFGIGGSALGNIALQTALNPYMYNLDDNQRTGPRVFILDNVDPEQMASFLRWLSPRLEKTIFNVITKSGGTTETVSQFMIIRKMLLNKLGKDGYRKRIVVTTDPKKGLLRNIAISDRLPRLPIPEKVGGRFSVLSAVGLFSAAMCGIDIDLLLEGARDMDKLVSRKNFYRNPAAINAAINYHFYNHGKRISIIMPYSFHLKDLADWYRQLWAESLGKKNDLQGCQVYVGPTPINALGTTDQHSQVQLYREGPNDKLFTFLQVQNSRKDCRIGPAPVSGRRLNFLAGKRLSILLNNEKKATEFALLTDCRPCLTVIFDRINEYSVGQFVYLFEATTSLIGDLFNIDPYTQPAVELGKKATFALMGKSGRYTHNLTYKQFAKNIRTLTKVNKNYLV